MSLGTRLFVLIAPAVLPPADAEEREFYEILDVPRHASVDDIKKAYRQKSLALHPDKIAQRQAHAEAQTAAAEYELVQEAYAALHDKKHRQEYDAVQCSVARYRFMQSGNSMNPAALFENLNTASCIDRTKLVSVAVMAIFIVLLQPILVAAKVNAVVRNENGSLEDDRILDVKWTVILIPWWLINFVWLLVTLLLLFLETNKKRVVSAVIGQTCWIVGWILLALAWDDPPENWQLVAVPFYLWQATQILVAVFDIRETRREYEQMISPEKLQQVAGHEATEEDLMELAQQYTVITVDPQEIAGAIHVINSTSEESLTHEEIEELKIHMSREYQLNEKIIRHHTEQIAKSCLVDLPFIVLVASQLDEKIDTSWWVVFLPVLIYLGSKLLQSCCTCFFSFGPEPELILVNGGETANTKQEDPKDNAAVDDGGDKGPTASDNLNGKSIPSDQEPVRNDTVNIGAATEDKTLNSASPDTMDTTAANRDALDDGEEPSMAFVPASADMEDFNLQTETTGEKSNAADADDGPKIDEETYRAWQSAYAKAEESEMEKQAKAHSTCCWVSFQLIMLCLVIGKIDNDYEADGDISYNTFWILFPIFLIAGLILLCCSCIIYGAGAEGLAGAVGSPEPKNESGDTSGNGETEPPTVFVPPPPPMENKPTADVSESNASVEHQTTKDETVADKEESQKEDVVTSKDDMNDLD